MFYDTLNSEMQVSYLIKPILETLKEAGGQLERSELRDRISEKDENIAEFEQKIYISKKKGTKYKKFDFKFNFALKELSYVGLISYVSYNPIITLTQKGLEINLENFDVKTEVRDKAKAYWDEKSAQNKKRKNDYKEEDSLTENEPLDDFHIKLQSAIACKNSARSS